MATTKTEAPELPQWTDCELAVDEGTATPLQKFIYDNEPAGEAATEGFRAGLTAMLADDSLRATQKKLIDVLKLAESFIHHSENQRQLVSMKWPNSHRYEQLVELRKLLSAALAEAKEVGVNE